MFSCFRMEIQFTLRLKSLQCLRLAVCYKYAIRTRIRIFVSRFRLPHYFRGLYKQPPLLRSKHSCSMCVCVCVYKCVRCLFGVFAAAKHSYNTHTHTQAYVARVTVCVCVSSTEVGQFDISTSEPYTQYLYTNLREFPTLCVCVCAGVHVCKYLYWTVCVLVCLCVSFTG